MLETKRSFNLRREASSLATILKSRVGLLSRCFNLRREASSLATKFQSRLLDACHEFQSQTRSQFPRYTGATGLPYALLGVSISDEKPVPSLRINPLVEQD